MDIVRKKIRAYNDVKETLQDWSAPDFPTALAMKEGGIALADQHAIDAIRALEGTQIAVLGGDVYCEKDGKMRPAYENWFCNPLSNENPLGFAQRSHRIALDFLQRHSNDDTTFYVLVLAGLGIAGPQTNG